MHHEKDKDGEETRVEKHSTERVAATMLKQSTAHFITDQRQKNNILCGSIMTGVMCVEIKNCGRVRKKEEEQEENVKANTFCVMCE